MVGRRRGAPPPSVPRRVTRSQSQVDRISALPDDLLLHVLTRLGCARTAALTGLLARRWRRVWTGLPEVSFHGLRPEAMHAALARVTRASLEGIDIHLTRGTRHGLLDTDIVTSLLHAAAGRSPVNLALTIPIYLPPFDLSKWIDLPRFDCATSIKLDVLDVRFELPAATTEFPKLETLSLSGCVVDLAVFVPRCPRLRVLSVTSTPDVVETIKVHSASLQELVVSSFRSTSTIDIVAPALRKLTMALDRGIDNSLSLVVPMVEEVTWRCLYFSMYLGIGKMWRVGSLKVRAVEKMELTDSDDDDDDDEGDHEPRPAHVLSLDIFEKSYRSQRDLAEELGKIPVTTFSVLELKIVTWSRALGPLLLNLLQICTAVQRLDMVLVDPMSQATESCHKWCRCEENNRKWRTETTISFIDLTEVRIKGFKGDDEEIHFLKMLFRCAPMLRRMTLKLSDEVTSDWYTIFLDTVQEYPYVTSSVYIG